MTEDQARATCRAAAQYMEQYGWVQEGYYSTPDGRVTLMADERASDCAVCLMGAVRVVTGEHGDNSRTTKEAYSLIEAELAKRGEHGYDLGCLHEWNDREEREAAEVIDVLWSAAEAEVHA